jgi:hypothetical protein
MGPRLHFDRQMGGVQTRRRVARSAALALALACACGRSTEDSPDGPAPSPPVAVPGPASAKPLPSCALLPPAEVAAALGLDKLEVPDADIRGLVTTCTYAGEGTAARVNLRFEMGASAATLAAARAELEGAGQRVGDVSGVGDRAFAATGADGRRTLTFLVGPVQVAIGSTDPLTRQKKLAARVVERLTR